MAKEHYYTMQDRNMWGSSAGVIFTERVFYTIGKGRWFSMESGEGGRSIKYEIDNYVKCWIIKV